MPSDFQSFAPYLGVGAAAVLVSLGIGARLAAVVGLNRNDPYGGRGVRRAARDEDEARPKKSGKAILETIVMLSRPILTCVAAVGIVYDHKAFQTSGFFPALLKDYTVTSITKALPSLVVSTLSEAYAYGSLTQQALSAMAGAGLGGVGTESVNKAFLKAWTESRGDIPAAVVSRITSLLAEAGVVAGNRPVTLAELLNIANLIAQQEAHVSISQRILGAFTIVNALYLTSILGMFALFGPLLWAIGKQLRIDRLMQLVYTIVVDVVHFTVYKVLIPTYKRTKPLIETLFYYLSLYAFVEATRYADVGDRYGMGGVMTAFTGVLLFYGSWAYSIFLRSTGGAPKEVVDLINAFSCTFGIVTAGGAAITHQSTLLGYVTVSLLLPMLGFYAFSSPLVLVLGFQDQYSMVRTAQGCLGIITCYVLPRLFRSVGGPDSVTGEVTQQYYGGYGGPIEQRLMQPFESAVSVIGCTGYMLALDIAVGMNYRKPAAHALYLASCAGLSSLGTTLGLPGLTNTALVFSGLYGATVYCTVCRPTRGDTIIFWVFGIFFGMYGVSRFLTNNPTILVGALTGGMQT